MKFVWRWIRNRIRNCDDEDVPMLASSVTKVSRTADIETERGLSIQVHAAIGGRIVSFRHYDHKTDRHFNKTYIVPEDQDFERELGKMITLESMR
jgi:hypothetical protein